MSQPILPETVAKDPARTAETPLEDGRNKNRKVPVAYEEIVLTEEAVEILDKEKKACMERPARKIRRLPAGGSR